MHTHGGCYIGAEQISQALLGALSAEQRISIFFSLFLMLTVEKFMCR
jgi:hypothetical protein